LKTARQELDIINAYEQTGSMRTAAVLCGTTHKTVKRVLDRRAAGQRPGRRRRDRVESGLAGELGGLAQEPSVLGLGAARSWYP